MRKNIILLILFLIIIPLTSAEITINTCSDKLCNIQTQIFSQNDLIYINFDSDTVYDNVISQIKYPDGKIKPINLPEQIEGLQLGDYTIEIITIKDETIKQISASFKVLNKNEPVNTNQLINNNLIENKENTNIQNSNQIEITPLINNQNNLKNTILIIIGSLFGLLIIIGLLLYIVKLKNKHIQNEPSENKLNEIAQNHDVHTPHKFLNKVINYIGTSLEHGFSTQAIYEHLKSNGWTENQINEGFKRFEILGAYHDLKEKDLMDEEIEKELAKEYNKKGLTENPLGLF